MKQREKLLTVQEVAALAGVSCQSVRLWHLKGWVRAERYGGMFLFREGDVSHWLKARPKEHPRKLKGARMPKRPNAERLR